MYLKWNLGHLGMDQTCPVYQGIMIFRSYAWSQLIVWIMQVSLFLSVHINRFRCINLCIYVCKSLYVHKLLAINSQALHTVIMYGTSQKKVTYCNLIMTMIRYIVK